MKIWVDCTAAAHPLVLRPVIERLRARGDEIAITTREYGQTVGILKRLGLGHDVGGSHTAGRGERGRAAARAAGPPAPTGGRRPRRSRAPASWARPAGFDLAIGHG